MVKHVKAIEDITAKTFNVWADGSFEEKAPYLGAGYMIYDDHGHMLLQRGRSFERAPHSDSTVAELLSCVAALSELPEGCTITLHSDCRFVIDAVQNKQYSHPKENIDLALKTLFNEVSKHDNVQAVLTHEGQSFYLKQAHNLSVAARNHKM